MERKGYTLLELLIVLSITVLLTTTLLTYNRTGERQLLLFKDQAKIINAILRAKSLAISIYAKADSPCAYGVHLDQNSNPKKLVIFKDLASPCSNSDNDYSGAGENFEVNTISENLEFANAGFTDILFIPPEPKVVIKQNGSSVSTNEASLELTTKDHTSSKIITVNKFGQVTAN